jgi:hypothetical protein
MTGGTQVSELLVVAEVLFSSVLIWTVVSKGEHSYGWSSASGGKMQGLQEYDKSFAAVSILMLVKFLLASTYLLGVSLYQPT